MNDVDVDKPEPEVLNATELMQKLGLHKSRFHVLRKRGVFKKFETKQPIGRNKYSRKLVEAHTGGDSTARFGKGSRSV